MDDATRILDAGTQDYPLDANTAASAEGCPHCSTTISAGLIFCPSCGFQRGTWAADASISSKAAPAADRGPALYELKDTAGNSYPLPAGESTLGRGEVDLQIADGYLSRKHAQFKVTSDMVEITDLGSANGSFVDGAQLAKDTPIRLADGQNVTLGKLELTLHKLAVDDMDNATLINPVQEDFSDVAVEDTASPDVDMAEVSSDTEGNPTPAPLWKLVNPEHGDLQIAVGETTLGRSTSKSDLQISGDGYISGLHGKLTATADSLSYTDLGSTNGSMLNGEALEANTPVELNAGDMLQLGQTSFSIASLDSDDEIEGNPDAPGVMA